MRSPTCCGRRRRTRDENLLREGVPAERIDRVGNIMIDSYEMMRPQIDADAGRREVRPASRGKYAVVTLHRPSNVDRREHARQSGGAAAVDLARACRWCSRCIRARARSSRSSVCWHALQSAPGIRLTEPLGYVEFMALVERARPSVTDSGGVQEETTYLGIPCLTLRENTERPITVTQGSNRLVQPQRPARRSVERRARREVADGLAP